MDVKMEEDNGGAAAPPPENTGDPPASSPEKNKKKEEKSPYEELRERKASAEEIVAKMLSIKKENAEKKPKSELRELLTQMLLNFVSLRQTNRNILMEEDRVKAETERAKTPVDSTTLQLHNLMYEKSHYLKAIKACKDFKSKYPDIELVSEEEFFNKAPEEFKGNSMSIDSAHNLMLKRLNYELYQRKELCKLREKLELRKKSLLETIANRKKFLSSLPSHLKALKKASLPAQNQLGVLHTKRLKQLHAAELLPPPLYIIYSQFLAQKEAFGESIELEVVGSLKDAHVFARQQALKDNGVPSSHENTRIDDDVPDEEDDGQRRRKRPRKAAGRENVESAGVYQAHPLKVFLHIYDGEISDTKPARLVSLKFEYLFKLKIVCVGVEGSDEGPENNILCNLFPDDNGIELPHQTAKLLLGHGAFFDEKRTMRPYKWAQHLAGIDFLPEVSPLLSENAAAKSEGVKDTVISGLSLYRQQNRVQTVVQRVRSRKKARLALAEQLEQLTNLKWPSLKCESVPWALHKYVCSLQSWSPVGSSPDHAATMPRAEKEKVHDSFDINLVGKGGTSMEDNAVATEDGELPSLIPSAIGISDDRPTINPRKGSDLDQSKKGIQITKSIGTPAKTSRTPSFGRHDEETDLMLDNDSDVDDYSRSECEVEHSVIEATSWLDYGAKEFKLGLGMKRDVEEVKVELEAKIKITAEYPLRPPLFQVNLCSQSVGGNSSCGDFDCYNELRAIEAEVNLHILKMLPRDQQNYVLSHQVHCLAMLFDLYFNEATEPTERSKSTSVIDVGLCKPVSGELVARSFRGRDRRKMISWKNMECTPGYPF